MFTELTFDELNRMNKTKKSIDFERYFDEMDLTKDQKRKRILLAEKLEDKILNILALIFTMQQYSSVDWSKIERDIENMYLEILIEDEALDTTMRQYARTFSQNIIKSTQNNESNLYYYTGDRAKWISENEANTIWNYLEFLQAINEGKTRKQWIDKRDDRERESHIKVGRTVKPIGEYFLVGNSLLLYPKDYSADADLSEIVNCRCSIKYY